MADGRGRLNRSIVSYMYSMKISSGSVLTAISVVVSVAAAPYAELIGDPFIPADNSYADLIGDRVAPPPSAKPAVPAKPVVPKGRWYTLTTEPGVEGFGVLNDRGEVVVERRRYAPGFGPPVPPPPFPPQSIPYAR